MRRILQFFVFYLPILTINTKMETKPYTVFNAGTVSAGIMTVAALRVLMAPLPNIEPVMLFTLVTGLAAGPIAGFLMGAGSMIVSNVLMLPGGLSLPWLIHMPLVTLYTSAAYGLVGLLAGAAGLVKKKWGRAGYVALAAALTLFYDLVTCVCFALQFYGPLGISAALVAQIPFTVLHLSNAVFAFLFAPYLFKAAMKTKSFSLYASLRNMQLKA